MDASVALSSPRVFDERVDLAFSDGFVSILRLIYHGRHLNLRVQTSKLNHWSKYDRRLYFSIFFLVEPDLELIFWCGHFPVEATVAIVHGRCGRRLMDCSTAVRRMCTFRLEMERGSQSCSNTKCIDDPALTRQQRLNQEAWKRKALMSEGGTRASINTYESSPNNKQLSSIWVKPL